MPDRRFVFEPRELFPRLGWCARIAHAEPTVRVAHGAWLETSPSAFVEGAWDGSFLDFDFDRSAAFQGSGGRLRDGQLLFISPTHPLERLYLVRLADELLISNSLSCLLAESDDGPDFAYPDYFFRLLEHFREGVSAGTVSLPTARSRRVQLFAVCDLTVASDLRVTPREKDPGPEPRDYADLEGLLRSAVERTAANAADPNRKQSYQPIAAVSTGYDSVASASLAAQVGCKRAFTFATSASRGDLVDDHGGKVAAALGLECETFDRLDVYRLSPERQAEYFMSPACRGDHGLGVVDRLLHGALLFTGRHGERVWSRNPTATVPDFAEPDATLATGLNPVEHRHRVGWIAFHVPYLNARHSAALVRITRSDEMRPWSVSDDYDRPIARRLAEEAGVPRKLFGVRKAGGLGRAGSQLSPDAERTLEAFLQEHVPGPIQGMLRKRNGRVRRVVHNLSQSLLLRFGHRPGLCRLFQRIEIDRCHILWRSRYLYRFHWGLHLAVTRITG